jgi:lysophospholipase L1-like esterase
MNYQNLICLGDSLAFGARTYGCFPLLLGKRLTEQSSYQWRVMNVSRNGATARSLWFSLNDGTLRLDDVYLACLLIGTNDASADSPPDAFAEYYRQIIRTLVLQRFRAIFCGTIPPLHCDGHAFFPRAAEARRPLLNDRIRKLVAEFPQARLVDLEGVGPEHCVDPAHFNDLGNDVVAEAFCRAVLAL